MKLLIPFIVLFLLGCPETEVPAPDAFQCEPVGHCGPCDCNDATVTPACGVCPIGRPDGGVIP